MDLKRMWESQAKSFLRSGVVGEVWGYCCEGGCFLELFVCKTFPAISSLQSQHSLSPDHSEILPGHVCMCAPLHSLTLVHAHAHTYPYLYACVHLYTFTSPSPHTHTFTPRSVTLTHTLHIHLHTHHTHSLPHTCSYTLP